MSNHVRSGEYADGSEWEVVVTREETFRAYDVLGLDLFEVVRSGDVVSVAWCRLPDELTREQAVAVSALLLEAAG